MTRHANRPPTANSVFLGLAKRGLHPHLSRWYAYIESLPAVQKGIAAYLSAQKAKVRRAEFRSCPRETLLLTLSSRADQGPHRECYFRTWLGRCSQGARRHSVATRTIRLPSHRTRKRYVHRALLSGAFEEGTKLMYTSHTLFPTSAQQPVRVEF